MQTYKQKIPIKNNCKWSSTVEYARRLLQTNTQFIKSKEWLHYEWLLKIYAWYNKHSFSKIKRVTLWMTSKYTWLMY